MKIAALIPTLNRPAGLWRVLQSLDETAPDVVRVVATDPDDKAARDIAQAFDCVIAICDDNRLGCSNAWNTALAACPDADAYVIAADDLIFLSGWLEAALAGLEEIGGSGMVGLNAHRLQTYSLHYLMTRDFLIEHHGGVAAVPHYFTWGVDTEACKRAMRVGKYIKVLEAEIVHDWRGPDGDETYRMGTERRHETKKIYHRREVLGFPDDFKPVIGRTE